MRTCLPALLAMLAAASPAAAETRNFGINTFEKIRVDGPFKVILTTGVAPYAKAVGSAQAIDRVAIDVRDNTIVVHNNISSWSSDPNPNAGPVEVQIGTHDLRSAWLSGSGSLSINKVKGLSFDFSLLGSALGEIGDVAVDQFNINLNGTANARLSGQAGKTTSVVRGTSSLDASGLTAKDAAITADGSATVDQTVTNSVKVTASGPATIRLKGNPSCSVHASGSTTVTGCKSVQ